MANHPSKNELTLVELYPDLTPEQQLEAEENLTQFLEVLQGIFARLSALDGQDLTESEGISTMRMP